MLEASEPEITSNNSSPGIKLETVRKDSEPLDSETGHSEICHTDSFSPSYVLRYCTSDALPYSSNLR